MFFDDLLEARVGLKAQLVRALRVEIFRPALDDAHDRRVGLAPNEASGRVAGNPPQRGDLLGYRHRKPGHRQIAPRPDPLARQGSRMEQKPDRGARRNSSPIASGNGAPNTAIEEVKTTRGL